MTTRGAEIDGRRARAAPGARRSSTPRDAAAVAIPDGLPRARPRRPTAAAAMCLVEVEGARATRSPPAIHRFATACAMRTATPALEPLARGRACARRRRPAARARARRVTRTCASTPRSASAVRRCLHVCEDVQGAFVYDVAGAGRDARLDPRCRRSLRDEPVHVVRALRRGLSDAARSTIATGSPRGADRAHTRSTCGYCGVGCQVEIEVRRAAGARASAGVADAAVNRGHLCAKGRYAHDWRESPEIV